MHVLPTQEKDELYKVTQIWLVGQLKFAMLVMKKINYWIVKICINNINKTKLKTNLKTIRISENAQSISSIEPIIFILANFKFIYFKINFILEDKSKAKAKALFIY